MLLFGLVAAVWFVLSAYNLLDGVEATARFSRAHALFVWTFGAVCSSVLLGLVVAELLNPTRLVLTPQGVFQTGLWKFALIPWGDIEQFGIHKQGLNQHVGYQLIPAARARASRWRRWAALGTSDGVMFSGPGQRPRQILELLRQHHSAAIGLGDEDPGVG